MRNPLIPPHAKLVYVYLEGRLNEQGICWPSHATAASEIGVSEASVKRAVSWLRDNDLVVVTRKSKGYGTFNIYELPKRLPVHLQPKDHDDLLGPKDQDEVPKGQEDPYQKVTVTYKEEPLEEQPMEEEPLSRFDEFWNVYDKKTGKKTAARRYEAALKKRGVTEQLLIDAAGEYIDWQKSQGKHPEFTKDPATWLNGEHWNDERQTPPSPVPVRRLDPFNDLARRVAEREAQTNIRQIGASQ